jgi:epoxyqueuosine reductase
MYQNTNKNIIRQKLLTGGIDLVGFAKYDLLSKQTEKYNQWVESGFHADVHYLDKNIDKREDVRLIKENTKSVIVAGLNYYTDFDYPENAFKISRYAWGTDYHLIFKDKLEKLTEELESSLPGSEYKIYVDTGPILEKQWAILSGIGWQGKNSLILNRKFGSWFFIGIILTNLDLESDKASKNFCGKCSLCISACPTNAIVQPGVLDSRKCISYWNIEAKSNIEIPEEIAKKNRNWAFGCDICQDVCPWNKKVQISNIPEFQPRNNQTEFIPDEVLSMQNDSFNSRFKKSPIKRSKLEGIKRNIVAIQNNSKISSR